MCIFPLHTFTKFEQCYKKIGTSVYNLCNRDVHISFQIKKYHRLSLINFHNSTLWTQQTNKTIFFLSFSPHFFPTIHVNPPPPFFLHHTRLPLLPFYLFKHHTRNFFFAKLTTHVTDLKENEFYATHT